jgi:2-methylcitrate dehydratase PrpD
MNGISELSAFIVGLHAPSREIEKLRLHVADALGAWAAATATPEGRALIRFRHDLPARIGGGEDNLLDDIALHCALTRLSEVDDIHLASMITPGSIAIPAALILATRLPGCESADIAAAMLAGYETMIRLGRAIKGPDVLYRGIWPTYFAAPFATAAVAARLLRLNEQQTAHTLALALTMSAPSVGQHHALTTARWFAVGQAARNGVTAALAAHAGFTAEVDVLRTGLLPSVYGIDPALAAMSDGLGDRFALDEVSFKPWCAARQTMAATQALRELVNEGAVVAEIGKITAAVLPPHLKMINHGVKAGDRASYLTSLPYQMAIAMLQPERMLDLAPPGEPPREEIQSLMLRIEVIADESLLADYPSAWPARVSAMTARGRQKKLVRHVPGDPARPLDERELKQKFHRLAGPVLGEEPAGRLWRSGSAALHSKEALLRAVGMLCDLANETAAPMA